jgi:hypothetical protein
VNVSEGSPPVVRSELFNQEKRRQPRSFRMSVLPAIRVIKSTRIQAKYGFGETQPEKIAHDLAAAAMWGATASARCERGDHHDTI